MKIIEIIGGKILLPIDNEESTLLSKFDTGAIRKRDLDAREQLLANQLVVKDVLTRYNENGKIYFRKK